MLSLYVLLLLVLILNGVYAWPCLGLSDYFLIVIHLITILIGFSISGRFTQIKKESILYAVVLLFGCILLAKGVDGTIVKSFFYIILLLQILSFRKELTIKILNNLNKCFFVIIAISTGLYIIHTIGVSVPTFGVVNYFQYNLGNHLFFVSNLDYNTVRFYGLCVEPGYFAILLSCLICANDYAVNKYNIVYLLALLLTLSLGGIIITVFGWYVHYTLSKGVKISSVLCRSVVFIIIAAFILFVLSNLGGIGDVFTENIINRLQFDPEKGFVGNNRVNERFDVFWYSFLLSDQMMWGMGSREYFSSIDGLELDGASYRVFVMQYGVLYTCIFLISFLILVSSAGNKKYILPVASIYLLDFLQHGTPFQGVFLILFLLINKYQIDYHQLHRSRQINDCSNL